VVDFVYEGGQSYEVPGLVMANFLTNNFLSLLMWWLDNKITYIPKQMDEMFRKDDYGFGNCLANGAYLQDGTGFRGMMGSFGS
jgi:hypothetical protein